MFPSCVKSGSGGSRARTAHIVAVARVRERVRGGWGGVVRGEWSGVVRGGFGGLAEEGGALTLDAETVVQTLTGGSGSSKEAAEEVAVTGPRRILAAGRSAGEGTSLSGLGSSGGGIGLGAGTAVEASRATWSRAGSGNATTGGSALRITGEIDGGAGSEGEASGERKMAHFKCKASRV